MSQSKFGVPKLTIEQLKSLPQFQKLTVPQRSYALSIVAGATASIAYSAAYPTASSANAARACHVPLRSKKLRALLAVAFGVEDSRRAFLDDLDRMIANPNSSMAQLNALIVRGHILGI